MNLVKRDIYESVIKSLFKGKIVVIYGARQVGKTTLVQEILGEFGDDSVYLNCDESDVRSALTDKTSTEIRSFIGSKKLVVIDEAQRVENIGLTLKLIVDNFPETQVIATGSSSFELSGKISEPLTGRKDEFYLYPLSVKEMLSTRSPLEADRLLEQWMIYGMYPGVVFNDFREKRVRELATSYSYKDVLAYQNIRNPELLEKLLQAIALQIGNEVSYAELAQTVGINKVTVDSYIRILEQAFIIYRVGPFSRNVRNELKKKRKIYFYDLGMRNALINNLNPIDLRNDIGALWENFLMSERLKRNANAGIFANMYFWRTTSGQEIDYIEEEGGKISAFEFKWKKEGISIPSEFSRGYPESQVKLINNRNYREFLVT